MCLCQCFVCLIFSVFLSLSTCMSVCMFLSCLSCLYLSVLSPCLSVRLSACLSVCLAVCLPACQSVCLYLSLSGNMPLDLPPIPSFFVLKSHCLLSYNLMVFPVRVHNETCYFGKRRMVESDIKRVNGKLKWNRQGGKTRQSKTSQQVKSQLHLPRYFSMQMHVLFVGLFLTRISTVWMYKYCMDV